MIAELETEETKEEVVTVNFDLVKGDFTPSDASEIVTDLFEKKIKFHNCKNFSQHIRFNSDEQSSKDRVIELRLAQDRAKELLSDANNPGKTIRVNCTISIDFI